MVKSLGRVLLATVFITGGWGVLRNPDARVQLVEAAGIPEARRATILNALVMVVAGFMLAADILPKLAAAMLIGSLVPTTYAGHPFWKEEHPAGRAGQRIHFNKNLAMLGGLLLVLMEDNRKAISGE
ncbi:MAG TPA: DoxX family protein [Ktedonobacteraceae bacterium]|jgi:uncharacterized membrane protein YphA (DoxX/SURF4 family)